LPEDYLQSNCENALAHLRTSGNVIGRNESNAKEGEERVPGREKYSLPCKLIF